MNSKRLAMLAIAATAMPSALLLDNTHRLDEEPLRERLPPETGNHYRRKKPVTEADHAALARAEAKRQRKAARNAAQAQEMDRG